MKGLLHLFPVLVFLFHAGSGFAEDPVFPLIEEGDIEHIEEYLLDHDINAAYGESGITMLVHAIFYGTVKTTSWLIVKGADVNQAVDGKSPLMYAIETGDIKKVSKLTAAEADMEIQDSGGNTALFYAALSGNIKITKVLVKQGANLEHENATRKTAYDLAVSNNNSDLAIYLRAQYEKNLPDFLDGPHLSWKGKRKIKAHYLVHDSKSQITRRTKARFKADSDPWLMKGFSNDTLDYLIHSRKEIPPEKLDGVDRIMAIGDIHGGYDSLVIFLQQNGVIDKSFQWTWGTGHLVFVGDIFDRGNKVTQALWLIYQLEQQASEAGGAVHLILGNHEIMVLSGNINYISEKYQLITSRLNISYSWLFNKKTILGQWLRTKNTILNINDLLFVHAGLSPDILASGLSAREINDHVRYFLMHPDRQEHGDVSRNTMMGHNGPFWYRGYMEDNHEYQHLPEKELEKVLASFNAETLFIGHTNVKHITPLYNNRVYALDVPFYYYNFPIQGLLIEGDVIYLLNSSAVRKQIR